MKVAGEPPVKDCAEAISGRGGSAQFREQMLNTQVDAVRIDGEHATATAHTTATVGGVARQTRPAEIPLRWSDGRWLID